MIFEYCPRCGSSLIPKEIGDEGAVPFCEACSRPWFSFSYPCVICLVIDENENIVLIKQSYVSDRYICVAGYVKEGEELEAAAVREVKEELGLDVYKTSYLKSYYHEKSGNLMLGFACHVKNSEPSLSCEVDSARRFSPDEAAEQLKKSSVAYKVFEQYKISPECRIK